MPLITPIEVSTPAISYTFRWERIGTHRQKSDQEWFRQLVNDTVTQLRNHQSAFMFNQEQLDAVLEKCKALGIPVEWYKVNDDFYIQRTKKYGRYKGER